MAESYEPILTDATGQQIVEAIRGLNNGVAAENVSYDDTETQIGADNVQDALGRIKSDINSLNGILFSDLVNKNIDNVENGIYVYNGWDSRTTGTKPTITGTDPYGLLVATKTSNVRQQYLFLKNGTTFFRNIVDGAWSAWINELSNDLNKNGIGSEIYISNYTSESNQYTCPSDGYVRVGGWGDGSVKRRLIVNGNEMLKVSSNDVATIFVKKGMKVYSPSVTSTNVHFMALE